MSEVHHATETELEIGHLYACIDMDNELRLELPDGHDVVSRVLTREEGHQLLGFIQRWLSPAEVSPSKERLTPKLLAEYREVVKFGSAMGVGGKALAVLLDEIERLRDIISPGDAAAYEEGMAALKLKCLEIKHERDAILEEIVGLQGQIRRMRAYAGPYLAGFDESAVETTCNHDYVWLSEVQIYRCEKCGMYSHSGTTLKTEPLHIAGCGIERGEQCQCKEHPLQPQKTSETLAGLRSWGVQPHLPTCSLVITFDTLDAAIAARERIGARFGFPMSSSLSKTEASRATPEEIAAQPNPSPETLERLEKVYQDAQKTSADQRKLQDYDTLAAFFGKHALGPKERPSCLVCGHIPQEWPPAIQHAELPGVVVCFPCRDAVQCVEKTKEGQCVCIGTYPSQDCACCNGSGRCDSSYCRAARGAEKTEAPRGPRFFRLQSKTDKYHFFDYDANLWEFVVVPEPPQNGEG